MLTEQTTEPEAADRDTVMHRVRVRLFLQRAEQDGAGIPHLDRIYDHTLRRYDLNRVLDNADGDGSSRRRLSAYVAAFSHTGRTHAAELGGDGLTLADLQAILAVPSPRPGALGES